MEFKPTPIKKKEFLQSLKKPYLKTEKNNIPEMKPGQPNIIRGLETSLKGDKQKNISISLEDHDNTIMYYLENVIKPTIIQNKKQIAVPIIYGSPERWKSSQKDGYFRDKNGKVLLPLIVLKRESFSKNRNIGNKLDGNKVNNIQYFKQGYTKQNQYDNFSVLRNQKQSVSYKAGIIPDYIVLNYKLKIYTNFLEQMNSLVEAIEFASDSYWGDPERFLFRATIDDFPTSTFLEVDTDRSNVSELSLVIQGYIIPSSVNVYQAAPSLKTFNITKTIFKENTE